MGKPVSLGVLLCAGAVAVLALAAGCTGPHRSPAAGPANEAAAPETPADSQLAWEASLLATRLVNVGFGWPMPGRQRYELYWTGTVPVGGEVSIPILVPEGWHLGVICTSNVVSMTLPTGESVSPSSEAGNSFQSEMPGQYKLQLGAPVALEQESRRSIPVAVAASLRPARVTEELRRMMGIPDILYLPGMGPPPEDQEEEEEEDDPNIYGMGGGQGEAAWWTGVLPANGCVLISTVPPLPQRWAVVAASADGGNVFVSTGYPWNQGQMQRLRRSQTVQPSEPDSFCSSTFDGGGPQTILVRNLDPTSDSLVHVWLARGPEQEVDSGGGLRFLRTRQAVSEYARVQRPLVQARILAEGFDQEGLHRKWVWSGLGSTDVVVPPGGTNKVRRMVPPGIALCFATVSNNQLAHQITLKDEAGEPLTATALPDGLFTLPPQPRLTVVSIDVTNTSEIEDRIWFYHGYTKHPLVTAFDTFGAVPAAPMAARLMEEWRGDGFTVPLPGETGIRPIFLPGIRFRENAVYAVDVPEGFQLRAMALAPCGATLQLRAMTVDGALLAEDISVSQHPVVQPGHSGRILLQVGYDLPHGRTDIAMDHWNRFAQVWLYLALKPLPAEE